MIEENISQKFRLKILNEIRKYFNEEVKQIKLISKKQKKRFVKFSASTNTGCVSISIFASLVSIPGSIASSASTKKICVITAGIKKYNSKIKKNRRKNY